MLAASIMTALPSCGGKSAGPDRDINLKIVQTTDVHGNYFPYNFITREQGSGSLARVSTHVNALRDSLGAENVLLFDNGDILQGQPSPYYYNFIDTVSPHLTAEIMNYMGYNLATIGNHDVETGHAVYDRWRSQLEMPLLGANVVNASTGEPYLEPYTVIERDGIKIAVLGLLTPAIPAWLPESLWSGLRFDDMVETARKWVPVIKEKEKPDVMIGLFHAGRDSTKMTGEYVENPSMIIAEKVPGFDVVLMGHDHTRYNQKVVNVAGDTVLVLNPANNADNVAELDIAISVRDGKIASKRFSGNIVNVDEAEPDSAFMSRFKPQYEAIDNFVSRKIGNATGDFTSRDAYFGPSAFMTLLHKLQLEIGNADISFAAPLSFDAVIKKGDITMSDMFSLYKYENMLYTMELTGQEIKDYLEESYSIWTQQMSSPADHLLLFSENGNAAKGDYAKLKNPSYNFDSAAGINYTVDVTKPKGEKITITGMSDGTPFDFNKRYRVAINSYRGNGGGDLLTKGAGIPQDKLKERIVTATTKDLRFYLMKAIEPKGALSPVVEENWKFEPAELVAPAIVRDREILFGK